MMFPTRHSWKRRKDRSGRQEPGRKRPGRWLIRLVVMMSAWIAAGIMVSAPVLAMMPYETEYYDYNSGEWIDVQPIYVPHLYITGASDRGPSFSGPSDLYITGDDRVYVADTGNSRIVVLDRQGDVLTVIGTEEGPGKLKEPEGVFVDPSGQVYVADTGNSRIAVYDQYGNYVREFVRPESALLPDPSQYFFVPSKIVVDSRKVMYIVVKGSYQGIFRMNAEGEFTGFFGANKTPLTVMDRLKSTWMSKEQLEKEVAKRPPEVRNIALDSEGFIYTTTQEQYAGQVKRLNASGVNMLSGPPLANAWLVTDVAIDANGMLYALDYDTGKTTIYSPAGMPLFSFGDRQNTTMQFGVLSQPTSIIVNSGSDVWIADSHLNIIEVFRPTDFGMTALQAVKHDLDGNYSASKPHWQELISQNDNLSMAYRGLGHSLNREEDYKGALDYYRIAYDAKGFSSAYWNIRLLWIQQYFVYLAGSLVVGGWLLIRGVRLIKGWIASREWSPKLARYGSEISAAGYLLFHPYEGFYRLKDRKISFAVLAMFILLTVGVHLASTYGVGFVFKPVDRSQISLVWTLGLFIVPWITWVIANYLISTIKDGEGRLYEVLQTSIYAMVPFMVWIPLLTAISHILVLEERVIYDAGVQIVWYWVILMFFVMTQVIHNFEFMETARNMVISIATILLIWLFVTIMAGLGYNLFDFFGQLLREVKLYD
ncbi:YIP1 family protein [Paenibacillus spongiae]|uniref:6-bladed beta-propeller n=1 Tax=Paenibacillus spongiae TaxID=2909671 RepID=A0ABY5SG41_9BACL|nr:YIP1 family protein [Paenibacillus spongiae]UVI32951.1 6-bladed beta-propeller [Paenibacillus spongiae]